MSTISNRFFVTAIEDGATLHGSLNSTVPLAQGWNGSSAVPDWSAQGSHPMIYLTLMSGNTAVTASSTFNWKYNNNTIEFNQQGVSTDGKFSKTTTANGNPALVILENLATSASVNIDTITFEGSWSTSGGASIPFTVSTQIRLYNLGETGYLGLIDYVGGKKDFTQKGDSVTLFVRLYSGGQSTETSPSFYGANLYINGVNFSQMQHSSASTQTSVDGHLGWILNEADVTDNAIIRVDFLVESSVVFSAFDSIDDLQDPEYMYIQYNKANGQSATLRQGESVTFYIWVGRADEPTPDETFNSFKLKVLNAEGKVVTSEISGIPNVTPSTEWRTLTVETCDANHPVYQDGHNRAKCTIQYDAVNSLGKNFTGVVLAEQLG